VSAQDYLATRKLQRDLKQAMYQALDGVDALLTPTTETAAIRLDDVDQDKMPSRFTRFGNLLEMCALALPNGATATGLPLSLQIVCRGYDEAMALRIGHAYQQATDWHLQAPPTRPRLFGSRPAASDGGPTGRRFGFRGRLPTHSADFGPMTLAEGAFWVLGCSVSTNPTRWARCFRSGAKPIAEKTAAIGRA
jgi:hypothetical protein